MAAARSAACRIARRSAASSRRTTADRGATGTARRAISSSASRSALADGRTAKAGGRVVKNVAGYDLSKPDVRVARQPRCDHERDVQALADAGSFAARSLRTWPTCRRWASCCWHSRTVPLTPSAIEAAVAARSACSSGLKRRTRRPITWRVRQSAICARHGAATTVVAGRGRSRRVGGSAMRAICGEHGPSTIVKIAVLPTDVADVSRRGQHELRVART